MNISWDDFGLRPTGSENSMSLERSNSITGKKSSYMDRLRQNQQRIQKNRSANEKLNSENNELSNNVKEMLRKGFSISKVKKVTSELLETGSASHEKTTLVDGKSFMSSIGSLSDMFVNVSSSDTNENTENIPSMDQLPPTNSFLKIEEPWSFVQEALNLTSRNPSIIDLTGQTSSSQMNPSSRAIGMKRTISKIRQHSVENENESYLNNKSYSLEQKRLRYADRW